MISASSDNPTLIPGVAVDYTSPNSTGSLTYTPSAGETGIINQAGPYEATMKFYLHPAHGFAGTPETAGQRVAAPTRDTVDAKQSGKVLAARSHHRAVAKTRDTRDL